MGISYALSGVSALFEGCTYAVERMNYGPAEFDQIIEAGHKYEDNTFSGRDQLFWVGTTPYSTIRGWDSLLWFDSYAFQRVEDAHPGATLWGDNNPSWHDINQGYAGTCYIEAALASIAEFPDLVKNVFVTQETNSAGIYAFRFYIRGKPWIVTVDDYFLFHSNGTQREAAFNKIGKNNQFWAMLLEKAWAKVRGTYT